jgi:hypothetical protein
MIRKVKLTFITAIAAFGIALPVVGYARSVYTAGIEASRVMDSELAYGGHSFDRSSNPFSNEQNYDTRDKAAV